jgi:hypothetical protein
MHPSLNPPLAFVKRMPFDESRLIAGPNSIGFVPPIYATIGLLPPMHASIIGIGWQTFRIGDEFLLPSIRGIPTTSFEYSASQHTGEGGENEGNRTDNRCRN